MSPNDTLQDAILGNTRAMAWLMVWSIDGVWSRAAEPYQHYRDTADGLLAMDEPECHVPMWWP